MFNKKVWAKEYREKNKEKLNQQHHNWIMLHPNYEKEYQRNKRKLDLNFRVLCNLKSRIPKLLKGTTQSNNTLKLLGCSLEFLRKHLQSKFTLGMTWSNYGAWHVDHIKPCASFDLTKESEQLKCFHYTNLQPLWAKDNLIKGYKLI